MAGGWPFALTSASPAPGSIELSPTAAATAFWSSVNPSTVPPVTMPSFFSDWLSIAEILILAGGGRSVRSSFADPPQRHAPRPVRLHHFPRGRVVKRFLLLRRRLRDHVSSMYMKPVPQAQRLLLF